MKFFVYILESEINGSFYVGQTSDLNSRLARHNKGRNRSTKSGKPWKIAWYKEMNSRSEAMKLETKIKCWKKRESIKKFIEKQ